MSLQFAQQNPQQNPWGTFPISGQTIGTFPGAFQSQAFPQQTLPQIVQSLLIVPQQLHHLLQLAQIQQQQVQYLLQSIPQQLQQLQQHFGHQSAGQGFTPYAAISQPFGAQPGYLM